MHIPPPPQLTVSPRNNPLRGCVVGGGCWCHVVPASIASHPPENQHQYGGGAGVFLFLCVSGGAHRGAGASFLSSASFLVCSNGGGEGLPGIGGGKGAKEAGFGDKRQFGALVALTSH
ncbi:hypothetical protein JTE90_026388 [Oedothorax gibbosus]|uniref:Uncharacterized protein n=1 Tax=Oedothorax gibbosus TaxID=931172 RepID=A0AAV6VFF5_9ARAC|nr:hypothetical protein JTE90_026388 [Oedothorax gibbosus]